MNFNYKARTPDGILQSGTVEAASQDAAVSILQRHGLIIVSLDSKRRESFFSREIAFLGGVKNKDIVIFSRQLAILFEAQVPVVESFRVLIKQTEKAFFKKILLEVLSDIEGGASLSKAFSAHKTVFSDFFISMIASGEASGKIQSVFSYLADHSEQEYYLTSKIKSAMMYPIFIIAAFILAAISMMIFVVPQLTAVLEETNQELPFLTKVLIGSSHFIKDWILILLLIPTAIGVFLWRYLKTPEGKEMRDILILKIPIIGNLLREVYLSRFSENLSTLIKGGLPIIQSLQVTGDVVGNIVYKKIINMAIDEIKGGGNVSDVLSRYPAAFPQFVSQMSATGEKTGKLAQVLESVSRFYQKEVETITNNLTQLIEPILIVVLGIGVGLLVVSILMPIYNIASGF
ncbi:MAG: type II secretion system F family protein [Patescibacteria group bacterium]